ncbi:MAG TPA: TIM-barrel domain-containing protein [Gaiellaceae bacterium]|nr:TIM-barrel domain-containing protein [Gaiellaceae bacterium]
MRPIVLLSTLVLAAAAAGCGGSTSAHGLGVRVAEKSASVDVREGGKTLTELGGDNAPFVYWTADGNEHRATSIVGNVAPSGGATYTLATDEPGRTASLTVTHGRGLVHVRYAVSGAASISAIGFSMTASPDAHFLGTGQRQRWVDMSKTVQPLKVFNGCDSSSPSPFFASTAGFGAWVSTTAVGRIGFPGAVDDSNFACDLGTSPCSVGPPEDAVRWCFKTADATITIAPGTLPQILTAHARAVGLPRKPWLPQFALIKWRDEISGPNELFDDIHQLRSRNLPLGWLILDNPWESGSAVAGCYGSLTFDPARYPSPKQMIERIHSLGVRFMLWVSPQIKKKNCTPAGYPDGWLTGDDETLVRDLTLPAARADFVRRLKRLVALGVDGFKGDRGDEVNLEPDRLAGGPGTLEQNAYPLLYDRAAAAAFADTQFATLFRSAVPGSSAVLPGFVGPDAEQSYTGLEGEIRAAQNAGVANTPVWGSDVGGYSGGALTAPLFVRWAQFAALTPIFEVGGAGANARFWRLGAAAIEGFHHAATLHYELVPYLYSLARSAARTGLPVIRPLGLTWPDDDAAWSSDQEFTIGSALLAAPVDKPGTESSVYLPEGDWVDLFSGAAAHGDSTVTRTNGPNDFPLYLRVGSAIPDNFRDPEVWTAPWQPDDLLRPGRQGWLVALASEGRFRSIPDRGATLTADSTSDTTVITIHRALPQQQLRIYSPSRICRVELGNRSLPSSSMSALVRRRRAWATDKHSLVVKITQAPSTTRLRLTKC